MGRLIEFLVLAFIAGVCGLVASQIVGAKRINFVLLILLGFVGAFVGRWIAGFFGLPLILSFHLAGESFPLLWAIIGAMVVVGIASAIQQH
jgi:uncharacterized membrane protein YeaQ/YmgE (transglycosylase-associated protein family)